MLKIIVHKIIQICATMETSWHHNNLKIVSTKHNFLLENKYFSIKRAYIEVCWVDHKMFPDNTLAITVT